MRVAECGCSRCSGAWPEGDAGVGGEVKVDVTGRCGSEGSALC